MRKATSARANRQKAQEIKAELRDACVAASKIFRATDLRLSKAADIACFSRLRTAEKDQIQPPLT